MICDMLRHRLSSGFCSYTGLALEGDPGGQAQVGLPALRPQWGWLDIQGGDGWHNTFGK